MSNRIPVVDAAGNGASLTTEPRAVERRENVTPFHPVKLIALARALKDELAAQDYAMGKVAATDLYDEAGALQDHLSNFIAGCNLDIEGPEDRPYRRDPGFRAGGWGEV